MSYLNVILDNIEDVIIIINPQGEVLLFNEEASRVQRSLNLRPFVIGENILDSVNPMRSTSIREILEEIRHKKKSIKAFTEQPTIKGTTLYLDLKYIPVVDERNELLYINIIGFDITPRKRYEKKITAVMAEATSLIENANAVIISIDSSGYITDWNKHCCKITGYEKKEVIAKKMTDALMLENKNILDDLINRILNKETISNLEIPVQTKAGKRLTFLVSATTKVAGDNVTGITFVGQDITELTEYRKSLELKVDERTRELKRALKSEKEVVDIRSRFVSIASHEFRTPLSSIQFAAHFIQQNFSKIAPKEIKQKLENIENQIHHMNLLLDDVLTYSKNDSGGIQLFLSKLKVKEFTSKLVDEIEQSTSQTHLIETTYENIPSNFITDEKLLRNILTNLLTNSIKFSPGRQKVYWHIQGFSDQMIFTIRDEGLGIPPEEVETIFEPFLRGKAATTIPGSGLGLSIVKKAVELLSGTIQVESKVGSGTSFTVIIPEQIN